MVIRIDAPRDAQTHKIQSAEAVLARHRITVSEDITDLACTDAGFQIQLACQRLRREFLFRNLAQHLIGIHEDRVSTCRTLVRNAVLVELGSQVLHLPDTGVQHIKLRVLHQSDSQRCHVTTVHATVGQEALKRNTELFAALVPLRLVGRNESAHVHQTVFLGRHGH